MARAKKLCPHCQYDMTGVDRLVCPECGRSINSPPAPPRVYRAGHALWIAMILAAGALYVYWAATLKLSGRSMKTGDVIMHGVLVLNLAGVGIAYFIWWVNAREHRRNVTINIIVPISVWVAWVAMLSVLIV
ncbi:MAG: hypothetical protein IPM33_12040 [Phycisphaerales bacterium]|nr:hypothetical protein [Phycisphaerales bacterium]